MQPEGIIVCNCKFYIWALVGPWILQLHVAILKELRENHKVDAKPPCGFTLSQFCFLLIRKFPCMIFCIYFFHPTTFLKNIAGAGTIFELSKLFTRGSGNPLSVAAVLIKLMLSPSPTQIMCYYVFTNIGAKSSLKANRESAESGHFKVFGRTDSSDSYRLPDQV